MIKAHSQCLWVWCHADGLQVRTGYVHLYGRGAQLALIDRIAELEARHAALLAQLPQQTRQKFRRRHAEASEAQGDCRLAPPTFPQTGIFET